MTLDDPKILGPFSFLLSDRKKKKATLLSLLNARADDVLQAHKHLAASPCGHCGPLATQDSSRLTNQRTSLEAWDGTLSRAKPIQTCPGSWGNAFNYKGLNPFSFHIG